MTRAWMRGLVLLSATALAACGGEGGEAGAEGAVTGAVEVDGSSTVYPITEAVAEEFMLETGGDVRVTVGVSGTGGGFRRFCAGETAISNASRQIKESELAECRQTGISPIELPVAYDGIAVVVNPGNTFVQCLTVDELRRIWEPGSTVKSWRDVRPEWPATPVMLYGPGTSSGTFDYFTEAVVGEEDASRADYTASEDDNVLVQGVAGDQGALGYFGYSYYQENEDKLRAVAIDAGQGCVEPTAQTIEAGTYKPLGREVYIYVSDVALRDPAVRSFVDFYLQTAPQLVGDVGYVPLPAARYQELQSQLDPAVNAES